MTHDPVPYKQKNKFTLSEEENITKEEEFWMKCILRTKKQFNWSYD